MATEKPEFSLEGRDVVVQGRLCRVVHVDDDSYKFLAESESAIAGVCGWSKRANLFTFLQMLPETSPRYPYPFQWDNLAVLPRQEVLFGKVLVPGIGKSTVPQQKGVRRT